MYLIPPAVLIPLSVQLFEQALLRCAKVDRRIGPFIGQVEGSGRWSKRSHQ